MAKVNFKSLQNSHESLLQKQQKTTEENQQEFTREIRAYIEQAKQGGSNISSTRERDQIRANLRYWANYIYSIDKTFPDTELAPSTVGYSVSAAVYIAVGLISTIIILLGVGKFLPSGSSVTETPSSTQTTSTPTPVTPTPIETITATPTLESTGFNVLLSSPANGEDITPQIEFNGIYDNLQFGWAIHVLFIKDGKYFPIKEHYSVPEKSTNNNWAIHTRLIENPDELSKAQSYSVVLAISLDDLSRDFLLSSSNVGIEINSLPSTVITFQDTSRVIYRKPYKAIQESRIVYSSFTGTSYDLFTSRLDGSDIIRITSTQNYSETFPSLSPDGTKIVYIGRSKEANNDTRNYTLHIMDSNGQNDYEIINAGKNVLESPQWSPDSSFISYAIGDTSISQNETYWSIHIYGVLSEQDRIISGEPERLLSTARYHSWLPNNNTIIYNKRLETSTSGFVQVSIVSENTIPEKLPTFFDTDKEEFQPKVTTFENGYLFTYVVINEPAGHTHDIYMVVLDGNRQTAFDGIPTRLIIAGNGVVDYPTFDPDSNTLYYARNGEIRRVEFKVEGNHIILIRKTNVSADGEVVVEAGPTGEIYFDVNYMDTYFPIP